MNKTILEALNPIILQNIINMFSQGASVEEMLSVLSEADSNYRLYSYYLEVACGQKLDGSIFLHRWREQSQKDREEILFYLEEHAKRIRENIS